VRFYLIDLSYNRLSGIYLHGTFNILVRYTDDQDSQSDDIILLISQAYAGTEQAWAHMATVMDPRRIVH
jgi:hypothetical protein